MKIENTLDKLHQIVTNNRLLQLFTVFTRILLAIGFIPPSIIKIMGKPFTVLPDSNPVGHYFNALYQTGFYYEFIGWTQLIAAILLLFPRTAHFGALMFFPIILNIAVLTNSVGFVGTKYITALMFFASAYLVAWDYDRLKPFLFQTRQEKPIAHRFQMILFPALFAIGGFFAATFFASFKVANLDRVFTKTAALLTISGALFGLIFMLHFKSMRVGELEKFQKTL